MITLTQFHGQILRVAPATIESMEPGADTLLHFVGGRSIAVREPAEEIVRLIVEHRRRRVHGLPLYGLPPRG